VAELVGQEFRYPSKLIQCEYAAAQAVFSFGSQTSPTNSFAGGSFSRDVLQGQWVFQWAERYRQLIPPEALERLERVEAWIEGRGLKEHEKTLFPRQVWVATQGKPDPVLWVSLDQFLASVYEWG
jgi:hypothetical protein